MNGVGPPPELPALVCGSCGTRLPTNFKFCHECGTPAVAAPSPAEYKQVTVLFADVVHSMEIATAVGAERLREIMAALADRCAAVVRRYGATITQWTGDGIMAVFGAPIALEDHAARACLAALEVQQEAAGVGADVGRQDGIELRLRVGLNSGEVIAGGIGSGQFGYAAVGEQVGMAQRMESVAPPGGIMLSASTARLVDGTASLGAVELVQIKGTEQRVPARALLGMAERHRAVRRAESVLIGRRGELAAVEAMLDRAIEGRGGVATVVGAPGIGKSRMAREAAAAAAARGIDVVWTFCESHASDLPFHAVSTLLRASIGVADQRGEDARRRVRERVRHTDPQDLLLLDDVLGIADADTELPHWEPDTRRSKLTALINAASLARTEPTLFVIEDTHWMDVVSESLIADFLAVVSHTSSMALITYRPEYRGALTQLPSAQRIVLAPLDDSDITSLMGQLLGPHPSVTELAAIIAGRAAGNPFFAEEMVRELAQRGTLTGEHGRYLCHSAATDVTVPATVQATIEARIDKLPGRAKRTLSAAAVIGARFDARLLPALGVDPDLDDLLHAELIDQARFAPGAEYAFRHPLIRAVVYESQLRSDRADWHRKLAAAIEQGAPTSVDDNAALIAEHLQAAGDLHAAYAWHMRAGAWSTNRDLVAARGSWERARRIADAMPADSPDQLSMRIAPRTMLCATDWQAREVQESRSRFEELRALCDAAGDHVSLAIGMTALATELLYAGRSREGAQLASQQMALFESVGDRSPTMGLAFIGFVNWLCVGKFDAILRWSQTIIDLAEGDPAKGANFGVGSPLAIALAWRGTARWWLGRSAWRDDLHDAVEMARRSNAETLASTVAWTYGFAMQFGALRPHESAERACEEAVQSAHRASSDRAVGQSGYALGVVLLNRDNAADRHRGLELIMQCRDIWLRKRAQFLIPVTDVWAARETAHSGDRDAAVAVMREATGDLCAAGNLFYGLWATGVLVETLLERGAEGDVTEAERAIDRLTELWSDHPSAMYEVTLLRLQTMLCRARGDQGAFADLAARYLACAEAFDFERHIDWARALLPG
ncbi:adenylate/guanylate cyclase domain-containing protein [Mycolicibacter arupensis]|uniref:adenylate/guanylate cyclase domain-containing protein n=1 Tax=Mycolicibacter arupensis TaxID=342002 RepID=UPI001F20CD0D|nr:adenylate/guanylate cyclase domain-containing protein [Mycolicibacter arupensis]